MVAGSRSICSMHPGGAFTYTVNATTDVFTADANYTPTNGDTFTPDLNLVSTLPAPMLGITAYFVPVYVICQVSGQTFKIEQGTFGNFGPPQPCTGVTVDVATTGSGTLYAYLYTSNTYYLDADPTGYPMGTTFAYLRPQLTSECGTTAPTSGGKYYAYNAGTPNGYLCAYISIPSNATPGTFTTHTVWCGTNVSTNCTTFDWDIEVVAPPNVSYTPPGSFSSLASKTKWEQMMVARPCPLSGCGTGIPADPTTVSGPANYCDPLANPMPVTDYGAATSSTVSMYGWNLLFDNMAIYTGNTVYRTGCFATAMGHSGASDLQSVRFYVTATGGNTIGYMHFTESLFRACRVLNDSSYCTTGLLMQNNAVPSAGPFQAPVALRPMSFGLDDILALRKYGGLTMPKWAEIRDGLYSTVQRATESDASGVRYAAQAYQLAGLAAYSIIQDWQNSHDARAPWAVKKIADYIWAHYDMTSHTWMNLEGPSPSPWCIDTGLPWFMNDNDGNCGQFVFQRLQIMASAAFWWYYAYTGDTTYRDEGDELIAHIWDQMDNSMYYGPTGKEDSEMYYNSFNAVGWRTGTLRVDQWFGDPPSGGSLIGGNVKIGGNVVIH